MEKAISNIKNQIYVLVYLLILGWHSVIRAHETTQEAQQLAVLIDVALRQDLVRKTMQAQVLALRDKATSSNTLMDPKIKMGVGGLPTDDFSFDSDPMTRVSLGIMQQFGRGDSLPLQGKLHRQQSSATALHIQVREREVIKRITSLWLELGYQQKAQSILTQNQALMEDMVSFIKTNYGLGKKEAQDLLNAQLHVSILDEKIQANRQQQDSILAQLSEWLGTEWLAFASAIKANNQRSWEALNRLLPLNETETHYALLLEQPMLKIADRKLAASQTQVAIAQQGYKPQFGVEVMYGYRQAAGMNNQAASDLVSAFITLDMPLFTENRQDKITRSVQLQMLSTKYEKEHLLQQFNAQVNRLLIERKNLQQRLVRYQNILLKQAKERSKAIERGYQNNRAQFNDVILTATDELSLSLEKERLITDLNLANTQLAALVGGFNYNITPPAINFRSSSSDMSTSETLLLEEEE